MNLYLLQNRPSHFLFITNSSSGSPEPQEPGSPGSPGAPEPRSPGGRGASGAPGAPEPREHLTMNCTFAFKAMHTTSSLHCKLQQRYQNASGWVGLALGWAGARVGRSKDLSLSQLVRTSPPQALMAFAGGRARITRLREDPVK